MTEGPLREAGSSLHAVVIGVDRYLPSTRPEDVHYPSLYAAVRDATRVRAYLRDVLGVAASSILSLAAPHPPKGRSDACLPSYNAMAAALLTVLERATRGDHALLYFAGHGGRVPTALPAVKGANALDECLVPHDMAEADSQVLRDVELAYWVERLRRRGVFATLVLDCCHAGGAVRGDRRVRGVAAVDRRARPAQSAFGSWSAIGAAWPGIRPAAEPARRGAHLGPGRGLRPRGFALLAACRPGERAIEDRVAGQPAGLFTHALLEALSALGSDATYQRLHARVAARVDIRAAGQHPMLEGEGERTILGGRRRAPIWGIAVIATDPGGGWILLAAGHAHAVTPGDRLGVYTEGGRPIALAEVVRAGATRAVGRIGACLKGRAPETGDRALPVTRPPHRCQLLERLVPPRACDAGLTVRIGALPAGYTPGRAVRPMYGPSAPTAAGSWVLLRIDNATADELSVVVLASDTSGAVVQTFPEPASGAATPLDPDGFLAIPLRATLRADQARAEDRLWIVGAPYPLDLRWMTSAAAAREPGVSARQLTERQPTDQPDPWPLVSCDPLDHALAWHLAEARLPVIRPER